MVPGREEEEGRLSPLSSVPQGEYSSITYARVVPRGGEVLVIAKASGRLKLAQVDLPKRGQASGDLGR